jgi:hypothetical protein
VLYYARQEQS